MLKFSNLINGDQPVLVDFYADWCGPCKAMAPALQQFASEMKGKVKVIKVDVDKNQQAAQQYKVQSIPTLVLFRGGKLVWRKSGALQLPQLKAELSEHLF